MDMNSTSKQKTVLFAMSNSQILGQKISQKLDIPLTKVKKTVFADGEILLSSVQTIRNKDVFIVASTCKPVNDNIMELLIFIDSLKRASAKSITVAISYYGYARQDRKASGRQPISARLIADLLEKAGVSKVIVVDLHNASIQGFFSVPLDDLRGQFIFANYIKKNHPDRKFTVVSPDHGGAVRARLLAELISETVDIAIVDKRRTSPNKSEVLGILGNVKGRDIIIIDDMIDTGGTIIKAAEALKKFGANNIAIAATHGIFSNGFAHFEKSKAINEVLVTDTIEGVHNIKSSKLTIVSASEILANTIKATIESTSVTDIYDKIRSSF